MILDVNLGLLIVQDLLQVPLVLRVKVVSLCVEGSHGVLLLFGGDLSTKSVDFT